jgi:hypothetical protein
MKTYRLQDYVAKGKEVFVGLEDSKKTWKLAVRSERMVIHQEVSGEICCSEFKNTYLAEKCGMHLPLVLGVFTA